MPANPGFLKTFDLYSFLRQLGEDLTLTLPQVGAQVRFDLKPFHLSARCDANHLKNSLFLGFYALAQSCSELTIQVTVSHWGDKARLMFTPAESQTWPGLGALNLPPGSDLYPYGEAGGFLTEVPVVVEPPSKPCDLERAEELYGSSSLAREVLHRFLGRLPEWMQALDSALSARDGAESLRLAHTLKGSARNALALPCAEAARRMEEALQGQDWEETLAAWPVLNQAVEELNRYLKGNV